MGVGHISSILMSPDLLVTCQVVVSILLAALAGQTGILVEYHSVDEPNPPAANWSNSWGPPSGVQLQAIPILALM